MPCLQPIQQGHVKGSKSCQITYKAHPLSSKLVILNAMMIVY